MDERNTQRPSTTRPSLVVPGALLHRRDLLARGGVLLAGAAAVTSGSQAEAAGITGDGAISLLSIGFVPRCPSGKAGVASVSARVIAADRNGGGDYPHGVEITIHGLISAADTPLRLVAYFPKGDESGEHRPFHAAELGTEPTRQSQPVTFIMPLDAGGGVNLSLIGGPDGQEVELPFRLSSDGAGSAGLKTGTYFVAVTGPQRPNWGSYQVDAERPASGLLLSMMRGGQRALVPAGLTQVVLSARPAQRRD